MPTPLDSLDSQAFRRQLNTPFKVVNSAPPLSLELLEVQERDDPRMEFFCLHFRGPFEPRLAQRIHGLEHDQLGGLEIFLTPISSEPAQGTIYEAVFHRFRQPA